MVFLDSDLFVRHLRYPHDVHREINEKFLDRVKGRKIRAATSIYNVLEVCGVLSFNYTHEDLLKLYSDFPSHFGVKILISLNSSGIFEYEFASVFGQIQKKQALGDAQISSVIEKFQDHLSGCVSWNARHFEGKLSVPVMTPEEFLKK